MAFAGGAEIVPVVSRSCPVQSPRGPVKRPLPWAHVNRCAALSVALIVAALSGTAVAHGGGLNAEGCHNNRKTGDYHCHRAAAPRALRADDQGAAADSRARHAALPPTRPVCYVGPRGGTYTITASGRKNYAGC